MKALFYFVAIFMVLGMLDAAPPKPKDDPELCCMPDQLEYSYGETQAFVVEGQPGLSMMTGRIHVDYVDHKFASTAVGESNGDFFNQTMIGELDTGVMYLIDEIQQMCTQTQMPEGSMTGQCLTEAATYIQTVTIGLGTTVDGDTWMTNIHNEETETDIQVILTMSSDTCVPISEGVTGKVGDLDLFAGMSYYNVQDSISDPSVFDIPEICEENRVKFLEKMRASPMNRFLIPKQHLK